VEWWVGFSNTYYIRRLSIVTLRCPTSPSRWPPTVCDAPPVTKPEAEGLTGSWGQIDKMGVRWVLVGLLQN
jgi:hypothetical protein